MQGGINNSRAAEQMAMDYEPGKGYRMDHYTTFPQDGMSAITEFGPQFDPNQQYLAQHFELADHNFQPVIAPTQPNVMTALNGTAHDWYYNNLDPGAHAAVELDLRRVDRAPAARWKIYYALPPSILNGTIWDQIVPPNDTAGPDDRRPVLHRHRRRHAAGLLLRPAGRRLQHRAAPRTSARATPGSASW